MFGRDPGRVGQWKDPGRAGLGWIFKTVFLDWESSGVDHWSEEYCKVQGKRRHWTPPRATDASNESPPGRARYAATLAPCDSVFR